MDNLKISEAAIIDGVYRRDQKMGYKLYVLCREYYEDNFRGVFLIDEDSEQDIFQNTMITLLEKIDSKSIYANNEELYGKNGEKFTCSLTTYFMGIAKLKYKEWVRYHPIVIGLESDSRKSTIKNNDISLYREMLYGEEENSQLSIIADCVSKMSARCSQLLSLFYYEEKDLDEILKVINTYKSKDALKSEKYKCMKSLRESANSIYERFYK